MATFVKRVAILLPLLLAGEAAHADGNYDLPRSMEGITKCWNRAQERYGPNIQRVTQKTTVEGTSVKYYISMDDGKDWVLTCHPASGKLVVTGHKP